MYSRTLLSLVAGALVAAVLVAGCGGNDDDTGREAQNAAAEADPTDGSGADQADQTLSSKTISKKAFVKRANAICEVTVGKVAKQAIGPLEEAGRSAEKRAATEEELLTSVWVPNLQAEVDQIGSLGAPKGDRAQVEAVLTSIQEIVDRGEADPAAFVAAGPREYVEAARLAARYGISECPFG